MIGGYVTKGIKNFLSKMLPNQKLDSLAFDSWNGVAYQNDLELDKDFFSDIGLDGGLPLEVVKGIIGKANIKIPWPNVFASKIEVSLEDVCIVAYLKMSNLESYLNFTRDKKKDANLNLNEKDIENIIKNLTKVDPTKLKTGYISGYISQLLAKICISVKNVSIKFICNEFDDFQMAVHWGFTSLTFKNLENISKEVNQKIKTTQLEGFFIRYNYFENFQIENSSDPSAHWFDEKWIVGLSPLDFKTKMLNENNLSDPKTYNACLIKPVSLTINILTSHSPPSTTLSSTTLSSTPIFLSLSNDFILIFENLNKILGLVKQASLYPELCSLSNFNLSSQKIKSALHQWRLKILLIRVFRRLALRDPQKIRAKIDQFIERRAKYEAMYELKILNLMESVGENSGERMYEESMLVAWEGEDRELGWVLVRLGEFEGGFASAEEVIGYRERVIGRMRVSAYVKWVLEVRKRYCLGKVGYIAKMWKRPSGLWNRGDGKKNLENFVDRMDEGWWRGVGKVIRRNWNRQNHSRSCLGPKN